MSSSRTRGTRLAGVFLGVVLSACLLITAERTDSSPGREAKLKAALVYKLAKFVRWPPVAFARVDTPFKLCLVGRDTLRAPFDSLAGRTVASRPIIISTPAAGDSRALRACHLLYLETARSATNRHTLDSLTNAPVLTVSPAKGFARSGGMVELSRRKNRFALHINLESARRAEISVSSKLLELSTIVQTASP